MAIDCPVIQLVVVADVSDVRNPTFTFNGEQYPGSIKFTQRVLDLLRFSSVAWTDWWKAAYSAHGDIVEEQIMTVEGPCGDAAANARWREKYDANKAIEDEFMALSKEADERFDANMREVDKLIAVMNANAKAYHPQ